MVELNNKAGAKVSEKWVKLVVGKILKGLKKRGDVSVVLVGEREIKQLNKRYKLSTSSSSVEKKRDVTDVLSFSNLEGGKMIGPGEEKFLGEVIIGFKQAERQAREQGHSVRKELMILLVHGVLHLLSYEHEQGGKEAEVMRKKEAALLKIVDR